MVKGEREERQAKVRQGRWKKEVQEDSRRDMGSMLVLVMIVS